MKVLPILKRYSLILLQALCIVSISACICIYNFSSAVKIYGFHNISTTNLSLSDYRSDYFESDLYAHNMDNITMDIIRYSVIKDQLETDGVYDPDKVIHIGSYANRNSEENYNGPDAQYYLKDLIAWGQYGISQNGISHSYKVFDDWDEMSDFFGYHGFKGPVNHNYDISNIELKVTEYNYQITENSSNTIPMLDVISNRYTSVEGKNLEYYACDPTEYEMLVEALEESALALYNNYKEYLELVDIFNPDKSNIRFYVDNGMGKVFTNLFNYRLMDAQKLETTFKGLGEYIYAKPGSLAYLSNTPVNYDTVSNTVMYYSYAFSDEAYIWIGLDTSFPANDFLSDNYKGIKHTIRQIPFVISGATIALIAFISLTVYLTSKGKKRLDETVEEERLKLLDKLPIEIEMVTIVAAYLIVYIMSIFIAKDVSSKVDATLSTVLVPNIIITFLYSVLSLLCFYSIAKRLYCHSFFKGSYIVAFFMWLRRRFSFVSKWSTRIYESSGIAIRTWVEYIIFLIFNTFWACMLFFSDIPVISFIVLLLFDGFTGFVLFSRNWEQKRIIDIIKTLNQGDFDSKIDESKFHGINKDLANEINSITIAVKTAVERSSRDEKLKADLITNVSHDIKTPLTSIINYVDLIKRENIENERVRNYIKILDDKSQRLKQLTIDLVEASKITSGNITLEINTINFLELVHQAEGEFEEKFESRQLVMIDNLPSKPILIEADARYLWRVIENLFQNVYKYALDSTRVYLDVVNDEDNKCVSLTVKNVSKQELNINADELTERFIRGDLARSTEGSGLGLSIVKSLVKAHKGSFDIYLDGDLFKATVVLPYTQN